MKIITFVTCCLLAGKVVAQLAAPAVQIAATDISCAGLTDGRLELTLLSGALPVDFQWVNLNTSAQGVGQFAAVNQPILLAGLSAGLYRFTFTATTGADTTIQRFLAEPPPIAAMITAVGETCFGQNTGQISIQSVSGGQPPYQFAWNNGLPGGQTTWTGLPPGNYFLTITDAASCTQVAGILLPTGLAFTLDLGADTTLRSGDTLRLFPRIEPPVDSLFLQPAQGIMGVSSQEILIVPPFSATYRLTGISPDGCIASDDIRITVSRDRDIYLPNVFAPQAQSEENRVFTVFGSAGIRAVALLSVYDRFGRLWFENRNFPVNDPSAGWLGADGSDEAPPGVYLWRVVLQFTDGREVRLMGDVTLVR